MLVVTSAASDPNLLTTAEIAEAIGSQVNALGLTQLNARVSQIIASACGLERAGASVLTLRLETLTETIRLNCGADVLRLSRKPITEVTSLTENGTELALDYDYEQRDGRSFIRISNDCPTQWAAGKIVVAYKAGWATVPDELKALASKLAVSLSAEQGHDPALRRLKIDGVSEREWWVGSKDDPLITAEIMEGLRAGGYLMHEMVY